MYLTEYTETSQLNQQMTEESSLNPTKSFIKGIMKGGLNIFHATAEPSNSSLFEIFSND